MSSPILLLCLIWLIYVFGLALYNLLLHPLRRFPGPRLWAAFRLPYVRSLGRGDLVQRTHAFHEQYGPVVRLVPN